MIDQEKVKKVQSMMRNNPVATKHLVGSVSLPDADAKALANFLFRELIEEAHEKYDISQEDMAAMCKTAVNRTQFYLTFTEHGSDKTAQKAFRIKAYDCRKWGRPEMTEDLLELETELNQLKTMIKTSDESVGLQ